MKKLFLTYVVLASLAVTSCKDKVTADENSEAQTETTAKDTSGETKIEANDTPSFDDAKIQDYIDSYESYMTEYQKAAESKDMSALTGLATKGQDLATKFQSISGNLSTSDTEKLNTYMTSKAKELQEFSKKMME